MPEKVAEDEGAMDPIRWSNIIFLPFHPTFKIIVLICVILKCVFGPLQGVFPHLICTDMMDRNEYTEAIKYIYVYLTDLIYIIDTFLHIVHRQVSEEAMRREFMPKSALHLTLDIIAVIPFFRLFSNDVCPPPKFYPNIFAFSECAIMYRVVEYFRWSTSHSLWRLYICLTILLALIINCCTCLLLLMTLQGLCGNCHKGLFDWRSYVFYRFNETDYDDIGTYIHGTSYILGFLLCQQVDDIKPNTYSEFRYSIILMCFGYILYIIVIIPKMFAESLLSVRRIVSFHDRVSRIIDETKRRNPSPKAHLSVEAFYSLIWKKRSGITTLPPIIGELPRYLRLEIRQDLLWPVFYHSPTFRNTSESYKRWLCEFMHPDFKLPGERFYTGHHCFTHLYYLRAGVVQLISADDSTSPLLSLTGGTIFGDVSFWIPPLNRKVIVRCLTYCEVFRVSRADILKSLHKFPEDRSIIINQVKERIKHAHTLHYCKQRVRGLDRSEDEGIAWLKRRWWEINHVITQWKKSKKKERQRYEMPPEETSYHCAKFIGQLVLCTEVQLKRKTMFANVEFPWLLLPQSTFGIVWKRIVVFTVYLVLIFYPPNLAKPVLYPWFIALQYFVDLVYISDILVSLMTTIEHQGNFSLSFSTVLLERFKDPIFILDILATLWFENMAVLFGKPKWYRLCQFNRFLKIHLLVTRQRDEGWKRKMEPLVDVFFRIIMLHFAYSYVLSYFFFLVEENMSKISITYFFGEGICSQKDPNSTYCTTQPSHIMEISVAWVFELTYGSNVPSSFLDICLAMFLTFAAYFLVIFTRARCLASYYLRFREISNYHYFVSNLKKHYIHYKIHPDLLGRLDRYLICQWKYYHGMEIMNPNIILKDEPHDIYWKLHGELAVKIIGESRAFTGANSTLISELAHKAKFVMIPQNSVLFMFGVQCKNVTWVVNGVIKCEYHDEAGELIKANNYPGEMLSLSSVFLGKAALRTYTAATECEILYVKIADFFRVIKSHPTEWSFFENCINEIGPVFEDMFLNYVKKHREYQKKLRDRIFHARQSVVQVKSKAKAEKKKSASNFPVGDHILSKYTFNPESRFIQYWMLFRVIMVIISITGEALQGGSGAVVRVFLEILGNFCDIVAIVDIALKLFLAYYDANGLLISDVRKCVWYYGTRGLLLDVIGVFPWREIYTYILSSSPDQNEALLVDTLSRFAHVYLVLGYFDYIADTPMVNRAFVMIVKWQIFVYLISMTASHYLVSNCIDFEWNSDFDLIKMRSLNSCWQPTYHTLSPEPTTKQLHILFAQSLNLVQCGLTRVNLGMFVIRRTSSGVAVTLIVIGIVFWYILCMCQALLVLHYRGNTLFQHGVVQLTKFLEAERVDRAIIERAYSHFNYWWIRTKGLQINNMLNERIGIVFRQDLSYYFFKKTLHALDTLLHAGDVHLRELSGVLVQTFFLAGEDIIREKDLTPFVYIVHRGRVAVTHHGKQLALLTKGSIFGQLQGTKVRPIFITARAEERTDLLQITIKQFQETITDDVRDRIARYPQSARDYINLKKPMRENPYNSIQYILRGNKTIWLPWMRSPVEAQSNTWYYYWMFMVWFMGPVSSAILVLGQKTVPREFKLLLFWIMLPFDLLHIANVCADFFSTELIVVDYKCVHACKKTTKLREWGFYLDVLSLLMPLLTLIQRDWNYQLVRLVRLRYIYEFHINFCKNYHSKHMPVIVKFVLTYLLFHALTCGWMVIACRREKGEPFPVKVYPLPESINKSFDYAQWVPIDRRVGGCPRVTKTFKVDDEDMISFIVPKKWRADYLLAISYVIYLLTHTNVDVVVALSLSEIYYKIFMTAILYMTEMWLSSATISSIYTKLRELYLYDYNVDNLITYLKHNGISSNLMNCVRDYTTQLWARQKGYWLPEITQQAPYCLREDIFSALYLHHLQSPLLFRQLPPFFLRQLATRLHRVVVFPGKSIVNEGDVLPTLYFIHEGEVEKWFTDASGEFQMVSLLFTNGYFGLIPCLFPDTPFQFTYFARTVVDIVFLRHKDWQDLLDGYPDVKYDLYTAAIKLKHHLGK